MKIDHEDLSFLEEGRRRKRKVLEERKQSIISDGLKISSIAMLY